MSEVVINDDAPEIIEIDDNDTLVVTETEREVLVTDDPSLEVIEVEGEHVIVTSDESIQILTEGQQGPSGGQGPKGDKGDKGDSGSSAGVAYVYIQDEPGLVWDIGHGLGRFPSVTIVGFDGFHYEADIQYVDENNIRVTHDVLFSGKALLN